MSNRLLRFLLAGLLCLASMALVACGDDADDNDDEPQVECTDDDECEEGKFCSAIGVCISPQPCTDDNECQSGRYCRADGVCAPGCSDDDGCEGDDICVNNSCETPECTGNSDCEGDDLCVNNSCETPECTEDGDCESGEVCENFVCEEEVVGPMECEGVTTGGTEDCDPNAPVADGYLCMDVDTLHSSIFGLGPKCYLTCDEPPSGDQYCAEDTRDPCPSGAACLGLGVGQPGMCFTSQCQNPGDTSSCEQFEQAFPNELSNGANCSTLDPDTRTFFCTAAGPGQEGDDCDQSNPCGQGLICGFDSTCTPVCSGDGDCSGDDRCIGEDTGRFFGGTPYGICGEGCDPFSVGECSEGKGCLTLTPEDGLCTDAGPTPFYEACDGYIPCNSSSDCPNNESCSEGACEMDLDPQCADGGRCLTIAVADIGEVSEGRCLPGCDASKDTQGARDETCPGSDDEPSSFARFVNLADGQGDIDVYVDDALVIDDHAEDTGATGALTRDFIEMPLGTATIDVVEASAADNSSPLASLEVTATLNEQSTYLVVLVPDGSGGATLDLVEVSVPRQVDAPATGEAKMRLGVAADFGTDVDIFVTDVGDVPVLASATPYATDVSYGDATAFSDSMAADDYDVHLVESDALAFVDGLIDTFTVTLGADEISSLYVSGVPAASGDYDTLSVVSLLHAQAPRTSPGGFCYDLGNGTVDSGICFERCTGAEAYGLEQCTDPGDTCRPFGGNHVCWPSDRVAVGDACDPEHSNPCEEGAFCRVYGDGTGVCASHCEPGESTNDMLGCGTGEQCEPMGNDSFNFGRCGFACDPSSFPSDISSSDCPANLDNCYPTGIDDQGDTLQAFCKASGDTPIGDVCDNVNQNSCVSGGLCRRSTTFPICSDAPGVGTLSATLFGPVSGGPEDPVCREVCELFKGTCSSEDEACMVDGTTLSPITGFCMPADDELEGLASLDNCPYDKNGMMCGDGSVCTTLSGNPSLCLQFCNLENGDGCSASETCDTLFQGGSLGICIPD